MGNKGFLCDLGLGLNDEDPNLQAQECTYITDWTLSAPTAGSLSSAHRALHGAAHTIDVQFILWVK